jgi:hypothetical protein
MRFLPTSHITVVPLSKEHVDGIDLSHPSAAEFL